MDIVEDLEEGDGDLASGDGLLPGLTLAWGEEDCRDVVIFSVGLPEYLLGRITDIALTTEALLCLPTELLILISEVVVTDHR
jgi:hypothetical protein